MNGDGVFSPEGKIRGKMLIICSATRRLVVPAVTLVLLIIPILAAGKSKDRGSKGI